MAKRRKYLKRVRKAGITIIVLIIAVLVAEWVCRGLQDKLFDPKEQPTWAFHPRMRYTFKPYLAKDIENPVGERVVIDINGLGLREREVGPRQSGESRIVGLGGALTASVNLPAPDTYLRVLEKRFQAGASSAKRHITINTAISGYNLEQMLGLLVCLGETLDPDIVLVGLFVGDDVKIYKPDAGLRIPGKRILKNKSFLYHLVRKGYSRARGARHWEEPIVLDESQVPRWREIFARYGMTPEDDDIRRFVTAAHRETPLYTKGGIPEAAWPATSLMLEKLRDQSRALDAKLVLVLLPTRKQAVVTEWEMMVELLELEEMTLDPEQLQRELTKSAASLGIPVIDLLPVFRAHENPESLYLGDMWFWNRNAQIVAADAIHEFLVAERLLE